MKNQLSEKYSDINRKLIKKANEAMERNVSLELQEFA